MVFWHAQGAGGGNERAIDMEIFDIIFAFALLWGMTGWGLASLWHRRKLPRKSLTTARILVNIDPQSWEHVEQSITLEELMFLAKAVKRQQERSL